MTEEQEIWRGQEAKRILENPLVVETFDVMEQSFLSAFRASPPSAAEEREELHRTLRLLDVFKAQLTAVMNTGNLARKSRDDLAEMQATAEAEQQWDVRS